MRIWLGMLLSAFALAQTSATGTHPVKQPFSITISSTQGTAGEGSNVSISIVLKNTSNHDLILGEYSHEVWNHYRVSVRGNDGMPARKTSWYSRITGECAPPRDDPDHPGWTITCVTSDSSAVISRQAQYRTLKPNETEEEKIPINELYDLGQLGKYTIQVERTNDPAPTVISVPGKFGYSRELRMDDKAKDFSRATVDSNTIKVIVGVESALKPQVIQTNPK